MQGPICPLRETEDLEVQMYVRLWDTCRAWHALPRAGGVDEQPAPVVEALRRCEGALGEYQAWRHRAPEIDAAHMRGLTQMLGGRVVKGTP